MVVPPMISDMYTRNALTALQHRLQTFAAIAFLASTAGAIVFVLFGKDVLSVLFGSQYREGYPAMALLSLSHIVKAATGSCGQVLIMSGQQRLNVIVSMATGALAAAAMFPAAQKWGPTGVAAVVALGVTLQNTALMLLVHKSIGIRTWASLPKLRLLLSDEIRRRKRSRSS
jgi:O-antigen/teichoic acid export membrane protein